MKRCKKRGKSGWRGHSWQKITNEKGEHIGRKCSRCPIVVTNPKGNRR